MSWLVVLCLLSSAPDAKEGAAAADAKHPPLVVGWHDEFKELDGWKPLGPPNQPDVFAGRDGVITLRLAHVPKGFPYAYQWGAVTRTAVVDLRRYPVLIARVPSIRDGSYAHLNVHEHDFQGRPVRSLRAPTLHRPGLCILDVGKPWGNQTRRIAVQLIVGGSLSGACCEYDWIRFVRREDLPFLEAHPEWNKVTLKP